MGTEEGTTDEKPYGDAVIKLLDETERESPAIRERLGKKERGWWDAGRRPQAWNYWQGYAQWTLGAVLIFGPDPMACTVSESDGEAGGDE